jgi:hypothetical protein
MLIEMKDLPPGKTEEYLLQIRRLQHRVPRRSARVTLLDASTCEGLIGCVAQKTVEIEISSSETRTEDLDNLVSVEYPV